MPLSEPGHGPAKHLNIRRALASDLPAIVDIYNHYIASSHCTFDTAVFRTSERADWWGQFGTDRWQCWTAVAADDSRVLGYACSQPLKPKPAYGTSAEVSVYVRADAHGRGIASALYAQLLGALRHQDLHRAYALIALPNDASMQLHQRMGFRQVAHLTEVGRKFDRYWDVVWLEREL